MWTRETPKASGWYWCHLYKAGGRPFPVWVAVRDGVAEIGTNMAADLIAEWSGPIQPPELP